MVRDFAIGVFQTHIPISPIPVLSELNRVRVPITSFHPLVVTLLLAPSRRVFMDKKSNSIEFFLRRRSYVVANDVRCNGRG